MCGISGYWGQGSHAPQALEASLATLAHRGPDEQGVHCRGDLAMGMTRLAVIDVSGGHQPIYNEDATVAVVFNGEIYNYRELMKDLHLRGHRFSTHSDTEVLVHLYEEHGESMVNHLRGMFAFAIHDQRDDSLFLARDRFGKKPLFYAQLGGGFAFASEIKGLRPFARAAGVTWGIREQGIADYLSLGVVPQPTTIFEGVTALPAASWARVRRDSMTTQEYWRPQFAPKTSMGFEEAAEATRMHIKEAVRLRLRSDVPLGVFLSGGVDSSVVAYEAAQELGGALQSFTVATGEGFDESETAAATAQMLGIQHTVLPLKLDPVEGLQTVVRQYDQPFADSSAIPSLQVAQAAREHVTVVLNGDGGDEVFAGYRRYIASMQFARARWVPPAAARLSADLLEKANGPRRSRLGFAARFARGVALTHDERYLAWTTDMLRQTDKDRHWLGGPTAPTERLIAATREERMSGLDQQLLTDTRINLLSDLLVKMDLACMTHSLEARSPLLDHEVAEFAWRLPDDYRVRRGVPKAVLRHAYRDVLPRDVVNGAKRGFEVPLAAWLAGELRPMLNDTLGSANAMVRDYVDRALVDGLLEGTAYQDRNQAYLLYALLVLELWLQQQREAR